MMTRCFPSLYPYSSLNINLSIENDKLYFFNSGRASFCFIVDFLKRKNSNTVFLIPAFTCPSVVRVLEQMQAKFDFVDIDDSLNFNVNDLDGMIKRYIDGSVVVLVATSLFGVSIRNYKEEYPKCIVIEDLSQSLPFGKFSSDFQFFSFGKGKMISAWSAGAIRVNDRYHEVLDSYKDLKVERIFIISYLLTFTQRLASIFFWNLVRLAGADPDNSKKQLRKIDKHTAVTVSRIPRIMEKWILTSLNNINNQSRLRVVNKFFEEIDKSLQFNIGVAQPLLRVPIKKKLDYCGVATTIDYRYTYKSAIKSRGKELPISRLLLTNCSFIPTHELVNSNYADNVIMKLNE